jgi:pilus assembly protein Flp/PilA
MIEATTFPHQVEGKAVKGQAMFRLISNTSGVTAIEYALIAALIAVAAIAAFTLVGTNLSNTFSYVASQL